MRIETDRYSFDETPGITVEVVDKTIADIEKDYKSFIGQLLKEQYVNNRIKNTTGKAINFKLNTDNYRQQQSKKEEAAEEDDGDDGGEDDDGGEEDDGSIKRFIEDHGDEVCKRAAEIAVRERKALGNDAHDFIQLQTGSGTGCDYTIKCGVNFEDVSTGSGENVDSVASAISSALECFGNDMYEDIEVVEVVHRFGAFDVIERAAKEIMSESKHEREEKLEAARKVEEEKRALQKAEEEKNREKVEREMFLQLKAKYGGNGGH
jgi:hypothetical protein